MEFSKIDFKTRPICVRVCFEIRSTLRILSDKALSVDSALMNNLLNILNTHSSFREFVCPVGKDIRGLKTKFEV